MAISHVAMGHEADETRYEIPFTPGNIILILIMNNLKFT